MNCKINPTEAVTIIRYENGQRTTQQDIVITEYNLKIRVNGSLAASISCTPASLHELVMGSLYCEGVIQGKDDVKEIRMNEDEGIADVALRSNVATGLPASPRPLPDGFVIPAGQILEQVNLFYKKSGLFAATGAVHSCCLCNAEGTLYFEEDLSRHNAVDKIIGHALLDDVAFSDTFLITSGRVPSDMLEKIIRHRIPIVVSRSAPTNVTVKRAKDHNITLVGFARGDHMNLYAGEQRIL